MSTRVINNRVHLCPVLKEQFKLAMNEITCRPPGFGPGNRLGGACYLEAKEKYEARIKEMALTG